jgi:hypothetical protein
MTAHPPIRKSVPPIVPPGTDLDALKHDLIATSLKIAKMRIRERKQPRDIRLHEQIIEREMEAHEQRVEGIERFVFSALLNTPP